MYIPTYGHPAPCLLGPVRCRCMLLPACLRLLRASPEVARRSFPSRSSACSCSLVTSSSHLLDAPAHQNKTCPDQPFAAQSPDPASARRALPLPTVAHRPSARNPFSHQTQPTARATAACAHLPAWEEAKNARAANIPTLCDRDTPTRPQACTRSVLADTRLLCSSSLDQLNSGRHSSMSST